MLLCANNYVKYLQIDKESMDMLSPIIDFTDNQENNFMSSMNGASLQKEYTNERRIMNSGKGSTKRCVSETKKKYVASNQDWKCGHCHEQLNHTFEIDHKIRLEYGGGNDIQNLIALCRNCHGKKTANENM